MITLLVFIFILGLLVFVHELGHFVVARKNGIKCDEFGFGFPPRAVGVYFNEKTNKWKFVKGSKDVFSKNTVYSLNWFPIGGFVKIKGEDGDGKKDPDSFASKSALVRISVLSAGVLMNFILAWVLLSGTFMIGSYQDVTGENNPNAKIFIESIEKGYPAEDMGIKMGDLLLKNGDGENLKTVTDVQNYVGDNANKEISFSVQRGYETIKLTGVPRLNPETGRGVLGISKMGEVSDIRYGFIESFWRGLQELGNMFVTIGVFFAGLFKGKTAGLEVMGPVKLAIFTGSIIPLGFAFLLHFIAVFSINLGIINILPIPALDGGRILFIIIEKIKGTPVNQKIESTIHSISMMILLSLMLFITIKELLNLEFVASLIGKIKGFF